MKTPWIMLAVLGGIGLAVGCSRNAQPGTLKKEYKMQVTVGPQTHWGMGATRFAELAAQKTGGRIVIKPYFGGQLLKGAQLHAAQMVASGAIDLAFESTINTAPVIPAMNVFSLPFFVNTVENLDRLENGETGRLIFERMWEKGLMPLAWGENGFRQLTNSRHPVRVPADLENLKIRVVGTSIFIDIFRQLGADPVNMNWGDAVTAFQQGTVDGQENPVPILLSVQIHQFQKHLTLWNYLADPLVIYWCEKQWQAFPADIQAALQEAAVEAALFQKCLARAGLDDGTAVRMLQERFDYRPATADPIAFLEEKGMEVVRPTEDELRAFTEATGPVREEWREEIGDPLYQAALRDMAP